MTIDPFIVWNLLLTIIASGFGWAFGKMFAELKRLQILLNRTREDYATKSELRNETQEIKDLILRIENKLDRFIEKNNG